MVSQGTLGELNLRSYCFLDKVLPEKYGNISTSQAAKEVIKVVASLPVRILLKVVLKSRPDVCKLHWCECSRFGDVEF